MGSVDGGLEDGIGRWRSNLGAFSEIGSALRGLEDGIGDQPETELGSLLRDRIGHRKLGRFLRDGIDHGR